MMAPKEVAVIGVPVDLGANHRGVSLGPQAVRFAGLLPLLAGLGYTVTDRGNLPVPEGGGETGPTRARHLGEITTVNDLLARVVAETAGRQAVPLIIGGDHSISIGSIAGVARVRRRLGLIWFDAHADYNSPETTPSGNIHGMSLAASLGVGDDRLVNCGGFAPKVREEHTVLIGIRDLDALERERLRGTRITVFTMKDIDQLGIKEVMHRALQVAGNGTEGIHVSFDLDVMDPGEAPGVGTPVNGGLSYREAHLAMEILADYGAFVSLDMVEVNPLLDVRNKTADLAVDLIGSAFGKRII